MWTGVGGDALWVVYRSLHSTGIPDTGEKEVQKAGRDAEEEGNGLPGREMVVKELERKVRRETLGSESDLASASLVTLDRLLRLWSLGFHVCNRAMGRSPSKAVAETGLILPRDKLSKRCCPQLPRASAGPHVQNRGQQRRGRQIPFSWGSHLAEAATQSWGQGLKAPWW